MPDTDEALDSALDWVAKHTREYIETNGEKGHTFNGWPCLILTTTGRKSGQARRNALIYGRDGDDYVLVASYGGSKEHPLWYRNLEADPNVQIQVGADRFDATARTATPAEREQLWPLMTSIYASYDEYQTKTERQIPVVIVTPKTNPRQ